VGLFHHGPPKRRRARAHHRSVAMPQMVRPLVAPMAEGAAEAQVRRRCRIRSASSSGRMPRRSDNIALFFGEDIFIAIASILLIKGFLEQNGILSWNRCNCHCGPFQRPFSALVDAFSVRLWMLDRRLKREFASQESSPMITLARRLCPGWTRSSLPCRICRSATPPMFVAARNGLVLGPACR
jgi:hypothetical protein